MSDEQIEINDSLFPIEDGIAFTVRDGIHPQYDLRKLMSNTIRSRPQWEDFGRVAAKIFYEEVERHRKALAAIRTPEVLDRALKITMLKMLGLDYRSDLLRDIDYDRALNTIAMYNKTKGTEKFVRYMGFIKDAKFELARLWTTDYAEFVDGPAVGWQKVYDDPPGPWYPTAHVGLLYEEFSNKTEIDEDDLRALFYRVAPINLVLEWIAGMLTVSVGTLWLATNWWEETEDSQFVRHDPKLHLYLYPGNVETTEDTLRTAPRGPYGIAYGAPTITGLDSSVEKVRAYRGEVDWSAATGPEDINWNVEDYVERVAYRDARGVFVGGTSPIYAEYTAQRDLLGLQMLPERWNYVAASDDPAGASYNRTNVSLSSLGATTYLDGSPARLVTATSKGYVVAANVPTGRHAITWKFKANSTSHVAIARGTEYVILNVGSLLLTKSSSSLFAVAAFEADGWIVLTATLEGGPVTIYPAWGPTTGDHPTASGSVFWRRLQVEDALYPSRPSATANGLPRLRPATRWTIPGGQLNRAGGFFLMHFMIPHPEWTVRALDLFEFIGSRSRLYARVSTAGRVTFGMLNRSYRHEIPDGTSQPAALVGGQMNKLAVSWSIPDRRMSVYLNGWNAVRDDIDWPANFTHGGICRTAGSTVLFTSFLKRLTLVGVDNTSYVPAPAVLSHLTS